MRDLLAVVTASHCRPSTNNFGGYQGQRHGQQAKVQHREASGTQSKYEANQTSAQHCEERNKLDGHTHWR